MAQDDKNMSSTKTIGGQEYTLSPTPTPAWQTYRKMAIALVMSPVLIPIGIIYSILMAIPPLRTILLSKCLPIGMAGLDKKFGPQRQTLLRGLSGRVLDVGSGSGAYLKYCREADVVVAVEPETSLHGSIQKAAKESSLDHNLIIVQDLADLDPKEHQFDWVILGNVLCEVPSVHKALDQVNALLKPGGKVYFSEHIAQPIGTWKRRYQEWTNPAWRHLMPGCNCNRDSIQIMHQTMTPHCWDMVDWEFSHMTVNLGNFVLGLAIKRGQDEKKQQ